MATKLALLAVVTFLTVACSSAQKLTPTPYASPPPLCPSQPKATCECNCNCNDDQVSLLQYRYNYFIYLSDVTGVSVMVIYCTRIPHIIDIELILYDKN